MSQTHQKPQLINELKRLLPESAVLDSEEDLRPYECDGLSAYRELPMVVVLPETVEQVQSIVTCCAAMNVPVVARGAGTGLSGGALPLSNGVLLSLGKFNTILDIDQLNRTARVQPGVRNLAISEAVAPYGLYYAPDPSSQIACSIGGNVAENSGGVHCLKYGLTVHNIQQLKIVTIDGELMTIGGSGFDAAGYDLLALMTGSEGMLGIIVEITVKLLPRPEFAQVVLAAFDDVVKAGRAVGNIIAAGIVPAGLEMMDNPSIRASEAFVHAGYPVDAAAILLCELDGSEADVEEQIAKVNNELEQEGATQIRVSASDEEREIMWKGRKAAFPAVGRISPDYYCMD
ncbi:MAG: FAD-binding protein, partial [Gammaproteobacteria bacterium]